MKTTLYTILAFVICISSHFTRTSSSAMIYQLQQQSLSRQGEELDLTDLNDDNSNTTGASSLAPTTHAATPATDTFDVHKFIQLFTNHLLMDHYDKAYTQLSKRISFQFRDAIQLRIKKVKTSSSATAATTTTTTSTIPTDVYSLTEHKHHRNTEVPPPVDVQILKRQLKGAVGSFIEDKLPILLLDKYNTSHLETHLHQAILEYCPDGSLTSRCLLEHIEPFLIDLQHYTAKECQKTLLQLNDVDLPRLFEKTRAQISGILVHFNQHTMNEKLHTLELRIKTTPANMKTLNAKKAPSSQPSIMDNEVNGLLEAYYQHIHLPFLHQHPVDRDSVTHPTNTIDLPNASTKSSTKTPPTVNRRNWITPEMVHEFIAQIHHTHREDASDTSRQASIQYFIDLAM